MQKSILLVVFLLGSFVGIGQNTRSAETPKPPRPQYQATKSEKKGLFSKSSKKKGQNTTTRTEVRDFRANVARRQKEKAKIEYKVAKVERKEAKKGKSFFGHKKPPKKRPPGKQKFCKVCRIKH